MILKEMTTQNYESLIRRTEAWLANDIKEYRSGVALLQEWIYEDVNVRMIRNGDPKRFTGILTEMLTRLKEITNYPRLIDSKEKAEKLYIAKLPAPKAKEIPGEQLQPPSEPPVMPEAWSRYAHFDTYKDRLSPELRQIGEKKIPDMFLNWQRLHGLLKEYDKRDAMPEEIAPVLADIDAQVNEIQSVYDSFEQYMTGGSQKEQPKTVSTTDIKPTGNFTKEEIERMPDAVFAAQCKMLRIEANKKYLKRKDIRNQKGTDLRRRELEEWGIETNDQ